MIQLMTGKWQVCRFYIQLPRRFIDRHTRKLMLKAYLKVRFIGSLFNEFSLNPTKWLSLFIIFINNLSDLDVDEGSVISSDG